MDEKTGPETSRVSGEALPEGMKRCPACGELMPQKARVCPSCGTCCCDPTYFCYPPREEDRQVYEKKYVPIARAIVLLSLVAIGCSLVLTIIHR